MLELLRRPTVIGALVVLFLAVVVYELRSGPDPQTGRCVDAKGKLVGCSTPGAQYKLARKVDNAQDCPSDILRVYTFRDSAYCGVALHGAPAPSPEYTSCLLLAGAQLAHGASDLAFAKAFAVAPQPAPTGRIKVRGDDWRIFYVLFKGQLDPGLPVVVANPSKVEIVAYITAAAAHRKQVVAATRCARSTAPAA